MPPKPQSRPSVWTLYKRASEWDDVIEGPDADGVEVVQFDDSFDGLLGLARLILDRHYPEAFFREDHPMVGADPGTKLVAALRAVDQAREESHAG